LSIVGTFEKPRLKGLMHYTSDYKTPKNAWVTARVSRECLVSFEGLTLKRVLLVPTAKQHQLHATIRPGHHIPYEMSKPRAFSTFFVVKIDRMFLQKT
jgi:hypothetical protein